MSSHWIAPEKPHVVRSDSRLMRNREFTHQVNYGLSGPNPVVAAKSHFRYPVARLGKP
jgi:hypothetical protein